MACGGNNIGLPATDARVLRLFQRTLGTSAEWPRRRKPGAYLGQVCVSADGPITLRRAAGEDARRIYGQSGRKRSLSGHLRRAAGDALTSWRRRTEEEAPGSPCTAVRE